ncbi:MAG: hypothetical protein BGN86_06075 [Caulobacterales bacterium 68-7]|nr:MAG: hypothetical protein BGN86_06075 [Caulobacterales bacterium 68-7]
MTEVEATGFRVRGVHVLFGVIAFFAVIIAADATFTVMAVRSFPGQVSVTPYEDGLIYNQRLAQLHRQDALGWTAAAGAGPGEAILDYRDRDGRPVEGLAVTGRLERPATESGRIVLQFKEHGAGRYVAVHPGLAGAWDLTAEAKAGSGAQFVAERRLTWP